MCITFTIEQHNMKVSIVVTPNTELRNCRLVEVQPPPVLSGSGEKSYDISHAI